MSSTHPYPGLRPFKQEETDIFFGREEHTDELLNCLDRQHFLAVIGLSGCGKSSLVKTGLIPNLQAGFLSAAGTRWKIAEMRPENQPFANLATALTDALGEAYKSDLENEVLKRGAFSLQELLATKPLPDKAKLLIVCDQFEEIFRYGNKQSINSEAAEFVALLLASAKPYLLPNGQLFDDIYIVVTMRSEYLGKCALVIGLAEAINSGLYLTPRLNREQLRLAIEEPALAFGGKVDPKLVVKLLEDAENNQDQLPLLQHLLMRLWDKASTENNQSYTSTHPIVIRLTDYEAIGTLKNALSNHADEAYNELNEAQQLIAKQIFCRLTGAETGKNDIRNPSKVSDLMTLTSQNLEKLTNILTVFRQTGRCFLMPPIETELTADSVIDIAHESLIRQWKALECWVAYEFKASQIYQRLVDSAFLYKKHEISLLHNPELDNVWKWYKDFNPTETWSSRYNKNFKLAISYLKRSRVVNSFKKTLYCILYCIVIALMAYIFISYYKDYYKEKISQQNVTISEQSNKIVEQDNQLIKIQSISLQTGIPESKKIDEISKTILENDPKKEVKINLYNSGLKAKNSNNLNEAIDFFEKYFNEKGSNKLRWNYYDLWANYYLGEIYNRKKMFDEAIIHYKNVININKNHDSAWYKLGRIYLEKNNYVNAVNSFNKHINLYPNNAEYGYYYLGDALEAQNKITEATEAYNKVLEISPKNKNAQIKLKQLDKKTMKKTNVSIHH